MKPKLLTVSSKGQVVLPSSVRYDLRITKGQKLALTVRHGALVMKPVRRLSEMEGILKGSRIDSEKAVHRLRKESDREL